MSLKFGRFAQEILAGLPFSFLFFFLIRAGRLAGRPHAFEIMQKLAASPDSELLCIFHTRIWLMFCRVALMSRSLSGRDFAPPSPALSGARRAAEMETKTRTRTKMAATDSDWQ